MLQTRKVNTYGRRSTAIVSASRLYTPGRETQWIETPDSPQSEGSSSSVRVLSPVRTRAKKSTVTAKNSEKKSPSKPPPKPKKENIPADLSVLSNSPPVAKPWKRKPLLVSSPKVRGSPKQRRVDKRTHPLASVSNLTNSPLQPKRQAYRKSKQRRDQTIDISEYDVCPIPGGYPPMHSTRRLPPVAPVHASKTPAPRPATVITLSDDSDSGFLTQAPSRRPQPLGRQNAMIGSPPIRLTTGSRLSGGSSSFHLGTSSRPNGSPFHPITLPSPRPFSSDGDLPSPIDSDDEVAFLDVVAELEAKPAPAPVLPPVPSRVKSEPGLVNPAKAAKRPPTKALGGPKLATVEASMKQKPPLPSAKSLPLGPSKSRQSIMTVEIPAQPRKIKPTAQEQPAKTQLTEQTGRQHELSERPESLRKSRSTKRTFTNAKPKSIPTQPPTPTQIEPEAPPSTSASRLRPSAKPQTRNQPQPSRPEPKPTSSISPYSPSLQSLLSTCSQSEPIDLEVFVSTFSTDDVHTLYPASRRRWRKIGEASYSEVFGLGGVVVKVVPLRVEGTEAGADIDEPCVSELEDVEKEIAITRAMGEIQSGFITLIRAHVARGSYPRELLELWDAYDKEFTSESMRPDCFSPSQLYVLLVLPDGGPDLEHYTFVPRTSWRTASSIFWQVSQTLAQAESLVRFEHRDLHWGQILIQNVPKSKSKVKPKTGPPVRVTLIDLGLSRMDTHTQTPWCTELEPEIFEGKGDYQFDVYRMMKAHCLGRGGGWEEHQPLTNVMWLHYLARQLLTAKGLRKPDTVTSRYHTAEDVQAESRACACLVDVEKMLGASVAKVGGTGVLKAGGEVLAKALRNASGMGAQKFMNARELVKWGAERRWVDDINKFD
ncbi:hypothetical protein FRC10_001449 [Ceratobasidium sp. 414]|nr:hypothetical protein FRC10_001449 [Ceratobasidium sp. 414]